MLPLMLMLIVDPLAAAPTATVAAPLAAPLAEPPSVRMIDAEDVIGRVVRSQEAARRQCRNGELHQAADTAALQRSARVAASDLMFRQGDPVQTTLLLERQIGGCSAPISYDVTTPDGRLPRFPARAD